MDANGNVIIDPFQRSKDILLVVLPLFSASIAYWVGAQGTNDAKKDAKDAKEEVKKSENQLKAVLAAVEPDALDKARMAHPEAF